jgi:hypothetical protein
MARRKNRTQASRNRQRRSEARSRRQKERRQDDHVQQVRNLADLARPRAEKTRRVAFSIMERVPQRILDRNANNVAYRSYRGVRFQPYHAAIDPFIWRGDIRKIQALMDSIRRHGEVRNGKYTWSNVYDTNPNLSTNQQKEDWLNGQNELLLTLKDLMKDDFQDIPSVVIAGYEEDDYSNDEYFSMLLDGTSPSDPITEPHHLFTVQTIPDTDEAVRNAQDIAFDWVNRIVRDDRQLPLLISEYSKYAFQHRDDWNRQHRLGIVYDNTYLQNIYQPNLCLLSILINTYRTEQTIKSRYKTLYDSLESYDTLLRAIVNAYNKVGNNLPPSCCTDGKGQFVPLQSLSIEEAQKGLSVRMILPFIKIHKIRLIVRDVYGRERFSFNMDVESRLRPRAIDIVIHNQHAFRVEDGSSNRSIHRKTKIELDTKVSFIKYLTLRRNTHGDEIDTMTISSVADLEKALADAINQDIVRHKGKKYRLITRRIHVDQYSLGLLDMSLFPLYLMKQHGIILSPDCIKVQSNGHIHSVIIQSTEFICHRDELGETIHTSSNQLSYEEKCKQYDYIQRRDHIFSERVIHPRYLTFMDAETHYKYHTYIQSPIIRSFLKHRAESLMERDVIKQYASIFMKMKKIPKGNYFDRFIKFDGQPIEDYTFYIVHKINDEIDFPLQRYSICVGKDLIRDGVMIDGLEILEVYTPSDLLLESFHDAFHDLWNDDQINHWVKNHFGDKDPRKWMGNKATGQIRRAFLKKGKHTLYIDRGEAVQIQRERGGKIRTLLPMEDDPKWFKKMDHPDLFLHTDVKSHPLESNFLLIGAMLMSHSSRQMCDAIQIARQHGVEVAGVHTDALYTIPSCEDQELDWHLEEAFPPVFDGVCRSFGTFKSHKQVKKYLTYRDPIKENPLVLPECHRPDVCEIHLENEFDLDNVYEIIRKKKKILFLGHYPGVGKTYIATHFPCQNKLMVVPTNELRNRFCRQGIDAITVHTLIGFRQSDDGSFDDNKNHRKAFSVRGELKYWKDYDCVCFDEVGMLSCYFLSKIDKIMMSYPDKIFIACGDESQNPPCEEFLYNVPDPKIYKQNAMKRIMDHFILLKKIKRSSDQADQWKWDRVRECMLSGDYLGMCDFVKKNCPVLTSLKEIQQSHLELVLAYRKSTCKMIGDAIHQRIHGDEYITLGEEMIYRGGTRMLEARKNRKVDQQYRLEQNERYRVIGIDKKHIQISHDYQGEASVPIAQFKKDFVYPYARTGHSYQGGSIDQPFGLTLQDGGWINADWLYTALFRARRWNDIHVIDMPQQLGSGDFYGRRIEGYMAMDNKAGRTWHPSQYIDSQWIKRHFTTHHTCVHCGEQLDDTTWTIDRIDDDIAHIKTNCTMIDFHCNSSHEKDAYFV